jgi:hypothetical protein
VKDGTIDGFNDGTAVDFNNPEGTAVGFSEGEKEGI